MNQRERVEQAELFLKELGRGIPEEERLIAGYAAEVTVQTDEEGKKINAGFWPVPYKEGNYIDSNKNCYVCISSSIKTPNHKTGKMRYWRGEASFGHGLCIMIDDIGSGVGSKGSFTLDHFYAILKPTAVVQTSPDNFQLFYFLDKPEPSLIRFKAFLSSFVANVLKKGGDVTIKDTSRYGRMPVGINNKRFGPDKDFKYLVERDGKMQPYLVELMDADYSRRYSLDELSRAFKFTVTLPSAANIDPEQVRGSYRFDHEWMKMAEAACNAAGMGEGSGGTVSINMSGKFRISCPWGDEHSNGDPFGAYFRGPIPGADVDFVFGCAHDQCRRDNKRTWDAFVDKMVMPSIYDAVEAANADPVENDRLKRALDLVYINHPGWLRWAK
jgi:hypothetical protein